MNEGSYVVGYVAKTTKGWVQVDTPSGGYPIFWGLPRHATIFATEEALHTYMQKITSDYEVVEFHAVFVEDNTSSDT
jgi:hypothetical protein